MTETRRMLRHEVPVDDQPHTFGPLCDPVHVAAKLTMEGYVVEFWAEAGDNGAGNQPRLFQVYGTGHPLPNTAKWVGTCDRINGFVWHLYEVTP